MRSNSGVFYTNYRIFFFKNFLLMVKMPVNTFGKSNSGITVMAHLENCLHTCSEDGFCL